MLVTEEHHSYTTITTFAVSQRHIQQLIPAMIRILLIPTFLCASLASMVLAAPVPGSHLQARCLGFPRTTDGSTDSYERRKIPTAIVIVKRITSMVAPGAQVMVRIARQK